MIVVTGPTGHIGHLLLDHLLDRGAAVRVIARDPARLPEPARDRIEVVQGSHDDPAVVDEAFAGAEQVFWLVPPNPQAEDVVGYYEAFTRPASEAIVRHGVQRVVAASTLGSEWTQNAGNLSAALAMDELLERTGVDYRSLRMPYFMENLLNQAAVIKGQGMFLAVNDADRVLLTVATPDVAAAAADVLLDDGWSGQGSVPVIGPDELSPDGMAEVISGVLGRPVRYQQVPGAAYKETMTGYGLSEAWAQGLVDMAVAQNAGIYDADARAATTRGATSFRRWCEDVLKPAVEA